MQHHRVLENDIDLDALGAIALDEGFSHVSAAVMSDLEIGLADYDAMFASQPDEPLRTAVWNNVRDTMFNRSIFFLHKGPLVFDSRSHAGLGHRLEIGRHEYTVAGGQDLRIVVRLSNTGAARWLAANDQIFGIVRLATHLKDAAGTLLDVDHSRHDLPHDVLPGESVELSVTVPLPSSGSCRLAFDLVAEGVTWFENVGSRPVDVLVHR